MMPTAGDPPISEPWSAADGSSKGSSISLVQGHMPLHGVDYLM